MGNVRYSKEEIRVKDIILFKSEPEIEDKKGFVPSYYFKDYKKLSINTPFKDMLCKIFEVETAEELKRRVGEQTKLAFMNSSGISRYDKERDTVFVYVDTYKKEVIATEKKVKRIKDTVKCLSRGESPKRNRIPETIAFIADRIEKNSLKESDKVKIAEVIPQLIRNGDIKISLDDITDLNKERLTEIIEIGRGIISKKAGTERKLGITRKQLSDEIAWQKFIEKFGSYILFGSIEEDIPQHIMSNANTNRNTQSKLDYLYMNKYGFIDIVELKKSCEYVFKTDSSHDNFVPTDTVNKAITQLVEYLMILPHDKNISDKYRKGAESASGLLVIGCQEYLMDPSNKRKYMKKFEVSEEEVDNKLRLTLRHLNYAFGNINIVLYDDLLNNLEKFLNQMNIGSK